MKIHKLLPILLPLLLTYGYNSQLSAQCNGSMCTIPTPSVDAQEACILPSPSALDCYYGATTYDAPISLPPSWCTSVENNHFFAFIADAPSATFEICTGTCSNGSGVQAALLSTFDCIDFTFVSPCLGNIPTGTCDVLVANNLNPGEVYYLMIDGNAGSQCEYSINGYMPNMYGPIDGLCLPNAGSTYTASSVSTWSIHPPSAGTILGNPTGLSVNVNWLVAGSAQICAKPIACPDAPDFCLDVRVGVDVTSTEQVELCENHTIECAGQTFSSAGNYIVTLPSYLGCDSTVNCIVNVIPAVNTTQNVSLCQGGSVFCGGEEFFAPGQYIVNLSSFQGCDSLVHCFVNIIPTVIVNLGTKYVCQGTCFQLGDSSYCNSGNYARTFKSALGCDSIIQFNLVVIPVNTTAGIQAPLGQVVTCTNPVLPLQSQGAPFVSHIWRNFNGDTLGTGTSILVDQQGFYFHETNAVAPGVTCSAQSKILVKKNNTPPPVLAMGGTLDAQHPMVQIKGNSIISGLTYHWEGPNGFSSNLKKPFVSVPGFYTLTVTNPQTGCTNSITVEVTSML